MTDQDITTLQSLGIRALFLVWGMPQGSHRSEFMSQQLGTDIEYVCFTSRRGWLIAPLKYFFQAIMTLGILLKRRYELIFVQDPPIFAVVPVYIYSLLSKAHFIIDSHTDALQAPFWTWTLPLHRFLERRAVTTIVTNDQLRELLASWGTEGFTLPDPPAHFDVPEPADLPASELNIVVVSTADYDEPIAEILTVARRVPAVDFYITGDFTHSPHHRDVVKRAPDNVHFTGYLREGYFALLAAADVIMCLTSEDNTFLSGDNEALGLAKPLITSDWPILRRYFSDGTLYVDNSVEQIHAAVVEMRDNCEVYRVKMHALREERRRDWWASVAHLLALIQQAREG